MLQKLSQLGITLGTICIVLMSTSKSAQAEKSNQLLNRTYKKTEVPSNIEIVSTQRNISMNDNDQVFKDYYLTGGIDSGIKENMVVKVVREIVVAKNGKHKDGIKMILPIALLKIVYVQPHMSIARLHTTTDNSQNPLIETPGVFVGDKIELEGAYIESSDKNALPKDSGHTQASNF